MTEYCQVTQGGVVVLDGGPSYSCQDLPNACLVDRSCACLKKNETDIDSCSISDGDLTGTVDVP